MNAVASQTHSHITSHHQNGMPLPVLSPPESIMMSEGHTSPYPRPLSRGSDPAPSEDGSLSDSRDAVSPKKAHSYKRHEEPPRNPSGKMICKFGECNNLTFERKCEWSKHMDKHDRPYKCHVRGCEKLQGFTYSGGLLRHEREVHKMHGGTKKSLFCPHSDCKRSSGAGFTRKENLQEHIRRVHRSASGASELGPRTAPLPEDRDVDSALSEQSGVHPVGPHGDGDLQFYAANHDLKLPLGKRKRPDPIAPELEHEGNGESMEDHLRIENKRLREENEEQRERLRILEATVAELRSSQSQRM